MQKFKEYIVEADKIRVLKKEISATNLYPTQREIRLGTALGIAIAGIDYNEIPFISKDMYILDGHHRWAATMLDDPTQKMSGSWVDLDSETLIPILRKIGDDFGNVRRRGLATSKREDVNLFKASLEDAIEAIETGRYIEPKLYNKEKAQKWLQKIGGRRGLQRRLDLIKKHQPSSTAPKREDMPVLRVSKNQHTKAAKMLSTGEY